MIFFIDWFEKSVNDTLYINESIKQCVCQPIISFICLSYGIEFPFLFSKIISVYGIFESAAIGMLNNRRYSILFNVFWFHFVVH